MLHDDSSQIAKLLMDGCNMGIQSIGKFLNEYEEASSESRSLAKKLLHMDEQLMKEFNECQILPRTVLNICVSIRK